MEQRRLSLKRLVIYCLIFMVLAVGSYVALNPPSAGMNVQLRLSQFNGNEVKLYYSLPGIGFDETHAVTQAVKSQQISPSFFVDPQSNQFRIDLGNEAGKEGLLESITLTQGRSSATLSGMQVADLIAEGNIEIADLTIQEKTEGTHIKFSTSGIDPHFSLEVSNFLLKPISVSPWTVMAAFIISLILTLLIYRYVHLRDIIDILCNILGNARLLLKLSVNDFKVKYAGSSLGSIWAFAQPVSTILLFWFVFQVGLRSTPIGNIPFILWLICGLIPWFFFSEAWNGTTGVYMEYSYLVKKIVFKIDILPIVKLISAWFVHMFFVVFMMVVFASYGYFPTIRMLGLVYYMGCMAYLVLGLGFITASIVVFFKDISPLMNIIMQFFMWLTPILWNTDILSPSLVWIFKLNPMYYVVQGYRYCMLGDASLQASISEAVYFWMAATVLLMLGISLFHRLKPHFADVL